MCVLLRWAIFKELCLHQCSSLPPMNLLPNQFLLREKSDHLTTTKARKEFLWKWNYFPILLWSVHFITYSETSTSHTFLIYFAPVFHQQFSIKILTLLFQDMLHLPKVFKHLKLFIFQPPTLMYLIHTFNSWKLVQMKDNAKFSKMF